MEKHCLHELFEKSASPILVMVEDKIVDCNASAIKLFHFKNKQNIINKHPSELSPKYQPDGRLSYEKANEILATAIDIGSHNFEWLYMRADRKTFTAEVSLSVILENNHHTILVILNDITTRKKIENDKLQTEKKLDAIINHRFQLTELLDRDGRLIIANKNAYDMVDGEPSELTGKYLWQLPHWSHSKKLQLEIKDAVQEVKKGKSINFETTHMDKKGDIIYIFFSLTPVHDDNVDLEYILSEGKDITEEQYAEMKLVASERNYREIFNSTSEAIFIHDANTGKIVDVNQTTLKMFGYENQEFLQLNIGDISSRRQQFTQEEALKKVKKTVEEGPQLFEWFAQRKNGECFWIEVSLSNTTIGGKGHVLAVIRNIDQRKKMEEEKKKFEILSVTDGLTGVANRRRFDEVLLHEYNRHSRSEEPLSVILLDLDYFKLFNDNYGHVNGDKCLQKVAGVIAGCILRPADLAARYGGEEFACILPETNNKGAVQIAEKIRQSIFNLAIPHKESLVADVVTVSLGVVTVYNTIFESNAVSSEQVYKIVEQADNLLYKSKSSGRNRVEFAVLGDSKRTTNIFAKLIWQESFNCGHKLIDEQHQNLFFIANELLEAILTEQPTPKIATIISSLLNHTKQHFQDEEKFLDEINYPDIKHHINVHEELLLKGKELSRKFKANTTSTGEIFQFLAIDVIKEHMLAEDSEFFPFMENSYGAVFIEMNP
ncbi:PAS domain S-box-containing protein/diguanylate cyclase (GGDEF) domain-containing protein/hemerythrin-like metal-binding domain protein [Peptoclostridium litorale DSM 5388]|uniref:Phytochrome-like protein Cph2 n=1 Tax=Peptoclostridium litorale DSM 5388 TaxID=1121324 RepID=A0A069RH82_PEPLI|nr:bacteriohemerythrin [Peptoclostridium litorale]KDR96404.1 phytochrome-like protein Cph2 [Peptoclostridium litorale DSM 5388]SIN70986.1 PAS domain S-box-containing protein/diguanylate cyclase (GGDEF) domain-containing protein/hemerythrin-like metal-binding domain protein [Peptoclostridium litorale DSM 5388]